MARRLNGDLTNFDVWLDRERLTTGDKRRNEIAGAIDQANVATKRGQGQRGRFLPFAGSFLGSVRQVLLGHFYYLVQCVIHTKIKVLVDSEFPAKLELKAS